MEERIRLSRAYVAVVPYDSSEPRFALLVDHLNGYRIIGGVWGSKYADPLEALRSEISQGLILDSTEIMPEDGDREAFEQVKLEIMKSVRPVGNYLCKEEGQPPVVCILHKAGLSHGMWMRLRSLMKFGVRSQSLETAIFHLPGMVTNGDVGDSYFAPVMTEYWKDTYPNVARRLEQPDGVTVEPKGPVMKTQEEYRAKFNLTFADVGQEQTA